MSRYRTEEPFGVEIPGGNTGCDNTHRFTGHERDLETGNDYMHFRYFSAGMGRFMKPDSIFDGAPGNPQGWNLYTYVKGNPVNFNDPTGQKEKEGESERPAPMIGPQDDMGISAPSMSLDQYLWSSAHAGVKTTYMATYNADGSTTLTAVGTSLVATQANLDYISTGNYTEEGVTYFHYFVATYESDATGSTCHLTAYSLGVAEQYMEFTFPVENILLAGPLSGWGALGRAAARELAAAGTSALAKTGLQISQHAAARMAENGVTESMMKTALAKGARFWDPLKSLLHEGTS
jgi:RHS repeat-associated protein